MGVLFLKDNNDVIQEISRLEYLRKVSIFQIYKKEDDIIIEDFSGYKSNVSHEVFTSKRSS
jgi:hypothetical protein